MRVLFFLANRQGVVSNMCSAVTCSNTWSSWRETQEIQSLVRRLTGTRCLDPPFLRDHRTGQEAFAQCRSSSLSPHWAKTRARVSSASMPAVGRRCTKGTKCPEETKPTAHPAPAAVACSWFSSCLQLVLQLRAVAADVADRPVFLKKQQHQM